MPYHVCPSPNDRDYREMKPDGVVGERYVQAWSSSPGGALVGGVHFRSERTTERVRERLGVHHYTVDSDVSKRNHENDIYIIECFFQSRNKDCGGLVNYDQNTFRAEVCGNRAQRKECRPRQSYWNSKSGKEDENPVEYIQNVLF